MSENEILQSIKTMLHDRIGLSVRTIGDKSLERALRHRMRDLDIQKLAEYQTLLNSSEEEVKELVEEVVVPETWFFRNPAAFGALGVFLSTRRRQHPEMDRVNILSVPCSTGEEPYTISMALRIAGFQPDQYSIDAADISERALIRAGRGLYSINSFRGDDLAFREQFFEQIDSRSWRIDRSIQAPVRFQQANILAEDFARGRGPYDVIFCRNLLIYFERYNQERVAECLKSLLKPDGMIFLGHAETGEHINRRFTRSDYPRSFSYYHVEAVPTARQGNDYGELPVLDPEPTWYEKASEAAQAHRNMKPPPSAEEILGPDLADTWESGLSEFDERHHDDRLKSVVDMANGGNLNEAATLCQDFIASHEDDAQGYFLLGLIYEAQGKTSLVEALYRKSIYLDPNHHEALIHLAVHIERHEGREAAAQIKGRVQRVLARKGLAETEK